MLKFIMTVGPSGAGKSTYVDSFRDMGYDIHSSDALRAELLGDINDQSQNSYIFEQMYERTVESLSKGRNVVYDATNLNSKRRTNLLKQLKKKVPDFYTCAIVSVTSPENCIGRRALSDRPVPADVIMRQIKNFEVPTSHEGFDEVLLYFTECAIYRAHYADSILAKAMAMNHDNPHHPDTTIYNHSLNVANTMIGNDISNIKGNEDFYRVGMYHDIGKVFTKSFDEDGVAHYFNHANVSAYLYLLFFGNDIPSKNTILEEAFAIGNHMRHFSYKDKKKYEDWVDKLSPRIKNLLNSLTVADEKDSV